MFTRLLLLSLVSALATILYVRMGLYVLRSSPRQRLNQIFFLSCLALAFWAFGHTFQPAAPSEEGAWFWFEVAAAGWTVAPALLLHYFLLLARSELLLRHRWSLLVIYSPAAFFLYQALQLPQGVGIVGLVQSPWGWAHVWDFTGRGSAAVLAYFPLWVLAGLAAVHVWGRRSQLVSERRQARLIVTSGCLALALVSWSGIIQPWLELRWLPELPHVAVAVWVMAIRHAVSRYRLMVIEPGTVAREILGTISDAVVLIDRELKIVDVNGAGRRLFGVGSECEGSPIGALLSGLDGLSDARLREVLTSGGGRERELVVDTPTGRTPLELSVSPVTDEHGQEAGRVLVMRDIRDQKEAEAKLRHTATHDPLTGLPNRLLLDDRLARALQRAQRSRRSFALLLFDLDDFKDINDSYGHAAGDAVLREVGRRMLDAVRDVDTVCRLAGDEFLVILEDLVEPNEAQIVAQRILDSLESPIEIGGHELEAAASIGIAIHPTDGIEGTILMRNADLALYSAKEAGKNRLRFFAPDLEQANRRRLTIERGLRHAVENDELLLEYQPMVDLDLQVVTGVEALIRWRSPDLGLLPPLDFIPIAERTGLILPIGEWVLRTACAQMRDWQRQGVPVVPVSCNVSAKQLQSPGFCRRVAEILEEGGLAPELLELELTETIALQDIEASERAVNELARLGVGIVIDDFGAGYSSLTRLRHLPMQALKIDRAFIQHITDRPRDRALVEAIVAMARQLDIGVIAEGVETPGQLELLQAIDRPGGPQARRGELQGFIFSRPVAADRIPELLGHGGQGDPARSGGHTAARQQPTPVA